MAVNTGQRQESGFKWNSFIRFTALVLFALSCFLILPQAALAKGGGNPRYASIVMDADTGQILSQSGADSTRHPASLVKMMTLLMAFESIEGGKLRLNDRVTISRKATQVIPSKLGLDAGSSIRVEDAIYALVTKSANDVAVALAERIGGTESHFAVMMNRKAKEIGMTRTRFMNASGLHHPQQVSTARDMAKLARYILTDHPRYYHYFSTRLFTYQGVTHRNHNRLMEKYDGMDGFKTGYIQPSGFNLVASARHGNRRLIGVVFGGRSANSRNAHMAALLDRGFATLGPEILTAKAPLPARKPDQPAQLAALAIAAGDAAAPVLKGETFNEMIGEGDYDPAVSKRLETGLMAIAAHRGHSDESADRKEWAVQVGTFGSRTKTDKAIDNAIKSLPVELASAGTAMIAPLKTKQGWLFRGRLKGYTKGQALLACQYIEDCLPVSPQAY